MTLIFRNYGKLQPAKAIQKYSPVVKSGLTAKNSTFSF